MVGVAKENRRCRFLSQNQLRWVATNDLTPTLGLKRNETTNRSIEMPKTELIALADAIINSPVPFKAAQIKVLADFCQDQNPKFKRERWLDYIAGKCGENGGKIKK